MKLLVATPAYGEIVYTPYVRSLLRLQRVLLKRGDGLQHVAISYADVGEARNFLLTQWYDKSDASHILFVDADMGFEPQLVIDMLALNKPVVGVIAPRRQVDLTRVAEAAAKGAKPAEAIARGHDFVIRQLPGGKGRRMKGFLEVAGCGAGVLLVSRACVAQMLKKLPALEDKAAKKASPLARDLDRLIRAFDPVTLDGARLSEDYSFCHRWHELCGGEIWARYDQAVLHVGAHHFSASYADAGMGGQRVEIAGPATQNLAKRIGVGALSVKEGKGPRTVRGKLPMPAKPGKPPAGPKKNGGKPVRH